MAGDAMPTLRIKPHWPRPIALRAALWIAPLMVIVMSAPTATAQTARPNVINREYAIKAAFLYHFLSYVEWQDEATADADRPFIIGVFATDPFGVSLRRIAETKKVDGRSIDVKKLTSPRDAIACHILFIPETVAAPVQAKLLKAISGQNVLTVGESEDFIDNGGDAQFYIEGNKVRFAFNLDVVEDKRLRISSKLLALAKIISDQ